MYNVIIILIIIRLNEINWSIYKLLARIPMLESIVILLYVIICHLNALLDDINTFVPIINKLYPVPQFVFVFFAIVENKFKPITA